MKIPYRVERSRRSTVTLSVMPDGEVLVRAPMHTSAQELERIVEKHAAWIGQRQAFCRAHPEPTEEERAELVRRARELIPARVAYYAPRMGVTPAGITITGARTRFGSCSGKNRLSFSWRLMMFPPEAIDYVVVHELAHIRHHDHSPAFYRFIESVMPDHRERRAMLRQ